MLYITLRQYEYIVSVADTGSLTKSSAILNVSQPSLSVAITRVEQKLKCPIFLRGKGASIEVTPFGHRFVANARELLDLAATIERPPEGRLKFVLGCFEDIAPWYLAPLLKRLHAEFPNVVFQGSERRFSELACALTEGRMDVAISYDIGFDGSFSRRKLEEIAPVVFLSTDHPLAMKTSVELDEVAHYPLILFNEDLSEGFMQTLFARVKLVPTIRQKVASLEMMRSLAAHGVGVGISYSRPPGDISYDGKSLVTIPIATPQAKANINLIWSELREKDAQFEEILDFLDKS